MEYLTREELVRLFKVARDRNKLHHIAMLVGLLHGLRVSEMLAIRGRDICDGKLSVKRLKKSRATLHALRVDSDPLVDESPLLELARTNPDVNCSGGRGSTWTSSSNATQCSLVFILQRRTTMCSSIPFASSCGRKLTT